MTDLPAPDQPAATAAAQAANEARDAYRAELAAGTKTLTDLFGDVDAEKSAGGHRVLGHMHIRGALEALPKIGEVKSAEILDRLGIAHDEHLDVLGAVQRQALLEAAG